MAKALQDANKPYKLVTIKGVDHYFQTQDSQRQLFAPISAFLGEQLK
jgi:dipeptidyl aminopeptidase/acylaminoacyl peptidase